MNETDVQQVKTGQPAEITLDALPDQPLTGTVTTIAPVATSGQDVVTYKVAVEFAPGAVPVKVGMSANATIRVERRTNVLQVPNGAITTTGPFKTIQVLYGANKTPVTLRVETGATNGQMTEIVRCLDTNSQCLREGDQVALTLPSTTAGGSQPGGDTMFFGEAASPPGKEGGPGIIIREGPQP